MGRIIGIDLGTTTSEIAYIKNGKPEIITNKLGNRITPSVVGISDDNEVIVGTLAKRQAALKPEKTVMEVKRLMGSNKEISLNGQLFTPQQISAFILKELKKSAEEYLGETVSEAVITVPANFNDLQRQATKEAGELAGLKVERIINEPTAAAMSYGIDNLETEEKVLVYDLGGGTFDVTVMELFEGILDVKASRGNNALGGKDFDEAIEKYIVEEFKNKNGIDLRNNKMSMARIKEAAERAKIELSNMQSTDIIIPFIAVDKKQNPLEINLKLTREKFEELIMSLVESTEKEIDDALKAAGYKESDINIVLAVGGSSRIPCVRKLLEKKFKNKIKTEINPDEAVALGAAVQAGIKNDEIKSEDGLVVTDACCYTLGIEVARRGSNGEVLGGIFDPIIQKDTKIPCTAKQSYITVADNQPAVNVCVYQGDNYMAADNTLIGKFVLDGIPEGKAGEQGLDISFSYNLNGILEVTATIQSTGKSINKIIDMLGNKNGGTADNESKPWENCRLADSIRLTVEICEKKIKNLSGNKKDVIVSKLNELKRAVIDDNEALVKQYDTELTNLLFDV